MPRTRFTVAHRYDAAGDGARGCSRSAVLIIAHLCNINIVNAITMLNDAHIGAHGLQHVEIRPRLAAISSA